MKKNTLKFNVFDAAIIIFIISIIVCAYFSENHRIIPLLPHQNQKATVTLVTDDDVYNTLSKSDSLFFAETDKKIGTILSVDKRIKYENTNFENSIISGNSYENDVFEYVIRIKTHVKTNEEGKFINSETFCAAGSEFDLRSGNIFFNSKVEKIEID